MNIPGIEYFSGSLGHSLSVAIGVAIDCRMKNQNNKIVVVLGDGELNEGTIWEGALVAAAKKLDNLVAVVDRNKFQANIETEQLIPLEPIANKFEAFGWRTSLADGHDFESLETAFADIPFETGKPSVVIAETVRGKGLPSIEAQANRWFVNFTHEEVEELLKELHGGKTTDLRSEEIIAR
jgi:transketolase